MIRDDVCYLAAEDPAAHGIFQKRTETSRMVFCTVRSVGMSEFYRAKENGLEPTVVFRMPWINYAGEKVVLWTPGSAQERFRVVRTYQDGDMIELTCAPATIDSTAPAPDPAPSPEPEPDPDQTEGTEADGDG